MRKQDRQAGKKDSEKIMMTILSNNIKESIHLQTNNVKHKHEYGFQNNKHKINKRKTELK